MLVIALHFIPLLNEFELIGSGGSTRVAIRRLAVEWIILGKFSS